MAKKIDGYIKLQIPAGGANPAPPVGPALGQKGVNIMDFCKQFNAKTQDQPGMIIPVVITVYADRSFSFICKTPPAAVLIKKAAGLDKASGEPNKNKVGKITLAQARRQDSGQRRNHEEAYGSGEQVLRVRKAEDRGGRRESRGDLKCVRLCVTHGRSSKSARRSCIRWVCC